MPGLGQKLVRLATHGINPGLFQIKFQPNEPKCTVKVPICAIWRQTNPLSRYPDTYLTYRSSFVWNVLGSSQPIYIFYCDNLRTHHRLTTNHQIVVYQMQMVIQGITNLQ